MNTVRDGQRPLRQGNYFLGTLGALLGALIGAIPWAIAYHFGWFVGWLGFLIGICAVKGYEILCKKGGWGKALIIILATILGVIIGQIGGDFIDLATMISSGELWFASYTDIPRLYYYLIVNETSEFIAASLPNLLLGFVFAGLGVWRIIRSILQTPATVTFDVQNYEGDNHYEPPQDPIDTTP